MFISSAANPEKPLRFPETKITFGQGIESLEEGLVGADDDVREACRTILRNALDLQIGLFREMYDRIDCLAGGRLI
ncbi:hypothetical protein [Rhizobium sp. BE258]|jgi:hypothetical protein|uniref:hypothetical protein n=1 Tax=Rhizobium sp. BE258 TaxID=2817722 RepID=UPI000DD60E1D|nr:hypothetical protein [Rhizobium sp. BE258]MDR7141874.1 hypothetical protein [Rhizobium sp. BE258]